MILVDMGSGRHEKEQEGLPSSAASNAKQPIIVSISAIAQLGNSAVTTH